MRGAFPKTRMLFLAKFFLVAFLSVLNVSLAYKLNVPKVLLPYHSSKLITFTLEAKTDSSESADDICFVWSSSRPDIVTITPIYDKEPRHKLSSDGSNSNECSSKAIVSAVSKHAQRFTSIILAKETKTDKLIRCDVIVDKIDSIRIKHTTTHLYLEDSPESFTVEALDDEGNTFSSIDGLPFEYSIINDLVNPEENLTVIDSKEKLDSRNILRLSKFIDSEYAVSDSIRQLETIGLSGHKILIEGLKTGMANVQAKLIDSSYKEKMKTPLVRLLVVANILLEPSYTVYLLPGSTVKYNVFLIKQTSIEKISLPSSQYYFESRDATTADLLEYDVSGSTIIGNKIGSTEIVLTDRNMKEDIYTILPPPTALVHVVQPDHLVFSIKNWRSSWILEVGQTYEIMVHVYNENKQMIFPSDNLNIESIFEAENFRVDYQSKNGSYHIVTALKKGETQAKASLTGTFNENEKLTKFEYIARGEQPIELLDPIDLVPKIIVFARQIYLPTDFYNQRNAYEVKLIATGGSNSYYWLSRNSTIANVNSNGLIKSTATQAGKTSVVVTDTRNIDIQSKSMVYVLDPVDIQIHSCPVETEVGSKLYLNVKMNAVLEEDGVQTIVPITDCSKIQFEINIQDENIFRVVNIQSPFVSGVKSQKETIKDSCAILVLDALSVGRTSIKVSAVVNGPVSTHRTEETLSKSSLIQLKSSDLQIGSYSVLKSYKKQLVLSQDSSIMIHLFDGPLSSSLANNMNPSNSIDSIQSSLYATKITVSDPDMVEVIPVESNFEPNKYSYLIKCLKYTKQVDENTFSTARFSVWHKKSIVNSCPVEFYYELKVRCAQPHSLHLNQLLVNNDEDSSELSKSLSQLNWKCPIKLISNQAMVHLDRPLFVQVQVRDAFLNLFDNFTSKTTVLDWNVENKKMIDKSTNDLNSLELSIDEAANGLELMTKEKMNSQRVYFQEFITNSKVIGKSKTGSSKITARLKVNEAYNNYLTTDLIVNFVSDVRISPETLTIFNHPSNIVPLSLSNGSGYFHAEIETIKTLLNEDSQNQQNKNTGSVLKINHISSSSVVVSPLVNNGLTFLHVFDYCVPPAILKQKIKPLIDGESGIYKQSFQWLPSTTSKIQVAGINSIVSNYEDDKVEVKNQLKIYVQISDATGNLIKTNYFSLMNLNAKLTIGSENGVVPESFGSILPATSEEYANTTLKEEDKEYTAIFILSAYRTGMINIQFEARSDGYIMEQANIATKSDHTIRSHLKEIQIYAPLNVQPKYIELVKGSSYQIAVKGGPMLTDAAIFYEVFNNEFVENDSKKIQVSNMGIISALNIGQVKVVAKSIGTNEKKRVYSEDYFVVKVVNLHSIQIQVPLKSIKLGNEMPVFLMANERKLTPLNFASSGNLRYLWKINDKEIGSLHDSLLDLANSIKKNDDFSSFDTSFSLKFKALQPGTVRISIKVEITDPQTGQISYLKDSIEVSVFQKANFNHLSSAYYHFKYPSLRRSESDYVNKETILMTPGSQFQIKTNLDKSSFKLNLHYQLSFFHEQTDETSNGISKYCNNHTVQVNKDGLITSIPIEHHRLKNAKQCIVTLLVSVYVNEQQVDIAPIKQQTLVYTIKIKPVVYTMLRLKKISKSTNDLNKAVLTNNIQMHWHSNYYDDLGDMFDVVNTNSKYSINRNDLIDFSHLNKNLFVYSAAIVSSSFDEDYSLFENTSKHIKLTSAYTSMSLYANAAENSFVIRTLKPGNFIMELTPSSAYNQFESKDYLGINIDEDSIEGLHGLILADNQHIKTKIGDIICLSEKDHSAQYLDFFDETSANNNANTEWQAQPDNIVQLIPDPSKSSISFALCRNEGKAALKKQEHSLIEISVTPVDTMKFLPTSVKYVTNIPNENLSKFNDLSSKLSSTSNLIQFQSVNGHYSQNCSDSFENFINTQNIKEDLIPFKCSASLYTESGNRHLSYLDQLIKTRVLFINRHWTCDVQFLPGSNSLMYDLIESNQEHVYDENNKNVVIDNEPVLTRINIETKQENENRAPNNFIYELPFIPAFHVQTKQIQLPISRNSYYIQNLKSKNFKEFSLNEHFNLILYSTRQVYSHLILTTNCPTLIKIKPLLISGVSSSTETSGSVLKITYDITTVNELFNLNSYADILQENNGNLYVQITCTQTQQVERVPIKFLFGMGESSSNFKPMINNDLFEHTSDRESWQSGIFGSLLDFSASQISSYLFIVILTLVTILCFLKLKSPFQNPTEQIALNASAAAAAAVAANAAYQHSPKVKDNSSFNPYRYFSPTTESDYLRSRDNQQLNKSVFGQAGLTPGSQRRSPQHQAPPSPTSIYNRSQVKVEPFLSPQRFNKFVPMERSENVRLFSVNSDVQNNTFSTYDHHSSRYESEDARNQSF